MIHKLISEIVTRKHIHRINIELTSRYKERIQQSIGATNECNVDTKDGKTLIS